MMKFDEEIKQDCVKVQAIFKERGYEITIAEAEEIWGDFSQGEYFSSWQPVDVSDAEFEEDLLRYAKGILGLEDTSK
jgi:hypothetical protein